MIRRALAKSRPVMRALLPVWAGLIVVAILGMLLVVYLLTSLSVEAGLAVLQIWRGATAVTVCLVVVVVAVGVADRLPTQEPDTSLLKFIGNLNRSEKALAPWMLGFVLTVGLVGIILAIASGGSPAPTDACPTNINNRGTFTCATEANFRLSMAAEAIAEGTAQVGGYALCWLMAAGVRSHPDGRAG